MSNLTDIKKQKSLTIKLADGNEYELRFTLNAMAELEERYGDVDKAFNAMDKGSFKAIRCVLWAGLQDKHPELTEQMVGSLIDMASMHEMMGQLNAGLSQDLPDIEGDQNVPN